MCQLFDASIAKADKPEGGVGAPVPISDPAGLGGVGRGVGALFDARTRSKRWGEFEGREKCLLGFPPFCVYFLFPLAN